MSASGTGLIGREQGGHVRRRQRRVPACVGAAALVMALICCIPATAASAATGELPITGEFSATGDYVLFECNYAQEFLTGHGNLSGLGPVTMDFEFCVEPAPPFELWDVTRGSFTITAASGTLTGEVDGELSGWLADPEGLFPGTLIFRVTGGTGDLEGATGSLVFDTLSKLVLPAHRQMIGTGSGTLTLP